ncbi:hypothetical protein [Arenimonas oryziterrae]|uniref:Uncharacterized protein n=1 Tax=Arenimonas oryziterrae DSM 21050 = YC6267 TaxID=1121015 RepID=A0A091BHR7_9GAMM|nr:hypothetical protein [Arenimonas oryziterrae]KFN43890.1 hypothetical protein N789_08050 [Arenimonas oryziterrae DSM 21050 = YC6267]
MKDLRNLLIDCRIELRKAQRDFHKTELCDRLDVAIQDLAGVRAPDPAAPKVAEKTPEATAAAAVESFHEALPTGEKAQTANQVALAWQAAARDLKFTDLPLYEALSKKVMTKLGTKTVLDQTTELRELEQSLAAQKEQFETLAGAKQAIVAQRDTLLGALATAVPQLNDGGDPIAVALARLELLKSQSTKAVAAGVAQVVEAESHVPTQQLLEQVSAGARPLTRDQREWCIGEAMVTSGFQYTPVELIEQGDAYLAKLILDARRG